MVSEAVTNAVKHARASQITVNIGGDDHVAHLEVADDGIGGADLRGSGLTGLRQRVEELGGQLTVNSPIGHGTVIRASVPCE